MCCTNKWPAVLLMTKYSYQTLSDTFVKPLCGNPGFAKKCTHTHTHTRTHTHTHCVGTQVLQNLYMATQISQILRTSTQGVCYPFDASLMPTQ